MPERQRMSPDDRRAALLDVGARLFAEASFEELSMADIAAEAGVTRRLLYHYFATKAEFFGAVWHRAHASLRAAVSTIDAPTVRDQIDGALVAYMDFYREHLPLVRIANRSSIAQDPAVRGPIEQDLTALCAGYLDAAGATGDARRVAEIGFASWIAVVRVSALAALVDRRISVAESHELCMAVLDAAVGTHVDLRVPVCGD